MVSRYGWLLSLSSRRQMHRSLIVVAYHYPPENAVGAARPARFVKFLPAHGWQCHVITAVRQPEGGSPNVSYLEDSTHGMWEGGASAARPSFLRRYAELAARRFLFPGAIALGWGLETPKRAQRVINSLNPRPSAVFSTFPPIATHFAGRSIARAAGIPWIADFRDPFVREPIAVRGRLPQYANRRAEAGFVTDAAAVIVNTEQCAELYRWRYPQHASKITAIWNGFDPDSSLSALPIPERPRRTLSHVGELYAGRNPLVIVQSLRRLRASGHAAAMAYQLELVGPYWVSQAVDAEVSQAVSEGWLTLRPQKIPKQEAVRLIQETDGMLLLQPQSSVQVPAKLYEYIRIGRPILAVSPRGSAVEWVLERCGIPYVNIYSDDPPQEVDRKLLTYLQLPADVTAASAWYQEHFGAEHQTKQLAAVLDRVVADAASGKR